jgi:hypothetical protein
MVEGLCSVIEGLCSAVEGLCKGRKFDKLLILIGSVGFSSAKPRKICRLLAKNRTYCANEGTGRIAASITILPFSTEIQCRVPGAPFKPSFGLSGIDAISAHGAPSLGAQVRAANLGSTIMAV